MLSFPLDSYRPLRPQTTIAIDQVKVTKSATQPSVKISIAVSYNKFTKQL